MSGARRKKKMADALCAYIDWCGSIHDEGCPEDDTCDCSGKWINDGLNAAVNHLRGESAPMLRGETARPMLEVLTKAVAFENVLDRVQMYGAADRVREAWRLLKDAILAANLAIGEAVRTPDSPSPPASVPDGAQETTVLIASARRGLTIEADDTILDICERLLAEILALRAILKER